MTSDESRAPSYSRRTSSGRRCSQCDRLQAERQYYVWNSRYLRSSFCDRCTERRTGLQYISYWGAPSYRHGSWRRRYKAFRQTDIDFTPLFEAMQKVDKMDSSFGVRTPGAPSGVVESSDDTRNRSADSRSSYDGYDVSTGNLDTESEVYSNNRGFEESEVFAEYTDELEQSDDEEVFNEDNFRALETESKVGMAKDNDIEKQSNAIEKHSQVSNHRGFEDSEVFSEYTDESEESSDEEAFKEDNFRAMKIESKVGMAKDNVIEKKGNAIEKHSQVSNHRGFEDSEVFSEYTDEPEESDDEDAFKGNNLRAIEAESKAGIAKDKIAEKLAENSSDGTSDSEVEKKRDDTSENEIEIASDDSEGITLSWRTRGYDKDFYMSRKSVTGSEIMKRYQALSNRSSKSSTPSHSRSSTPVEGRSSHGKARPSRFRKTYSSSAPVSRVASVNKFSLILEESRRVSAPAEALWPGQDSHPHRFEEDGGSIGVNGVTSGDLRKALENVSIS